MLATPQAAADKTAASGNATAVSNATFSLGGADRAPTNGHAGMPSTFQAAIASPEHITAALNFGAGAPIAVMTNAGANTPYEQRPAAGGLQRQVALYVKIVVK